MGAGFCSHELFFVGSGCIIIARFVMHVVSLSCLSHTANRYLTEVFSLRGKEFLPSLATIVLR